MGDRVTGIRRCEDLDGAIEALAAGEPIGPFVSAAEAEHVRDCAACQHRVREARRLDRALAAAIPAVPPASIARGIALRIQEQRWRRERRVDRTFNLALSLAMLISVTVVWQLLDSMGIWQTLVSAMPDLITGVLATPAPEAALTWRYAMATMTGIVAVVLWRFSRGDRIL
jgi:predicted anti-sigma-YlaC factor YlaD